MDRALRILLIGLVVGSLCSNRLAADDSVSGDRDSSLAELAETLGNQYRDLRSIHLDGSSTTKRTGIPDQVDTYSFASKGPIHRVKRQIGGNEFIQTFDGERSQFLNVNRNQLEILINRRSMYPIVLPHLMALAWLGDVVDSPSLQCHHLLNGTTWEDRFQDGGVVSEDEELLVVSFPCRKSESNSVYRVRFSKRRHYAVVGWEFVEDGRVKKTLEIKEHLAVPGSQFFLPASITLKAAGVEYRAAIANVKVNDQVELAIPDLSPLAEDIYNEFNVRDHVVEAHFLEAQIIGPALLFPGGGEGR